MNASGKVAEKPLIMNKGTTITHIPHPVEIGIELVNRNDGADPYPEEQYQVCLKLCKYLVKKYDIQAGDIMSHRAISLTGKTDPAGFDMDRLRRDVAAG